METCLLPCLTYTCQTWLFIVQNLECIKVCQRDLESSYVGLKIKYRIKNSTIRNKTKAKYAAQRILHLKWKWAGHIQRVPDIRWSKAVTNWLKNVYQADRPH